MQIWRMKADGSEQEQVTSDEYNNWFPHPSPDGRSLVFLSYEKDVKGHPENKDVTLRLMTLDGGEDRRAGQALRRAGDDQRPVLVARRPQPGLRQLPPGEPLIGDKENCYAKHIAPTHLPPVMSSPWRRRPRWRRRSRPRRRACPSASSSTRSATNLPRTSRAPSARSPRWVTRWSSSSRPTTTGPRTTPRKCASCSTTSASAAPRPQRRQRPHAGGPAEGDRA